MIDKKKLTIIGIIAGGIILALVAALIWVTMTAGARPTSVPAGPAPVGAGQEPSGSPTRSARPVEQLPEAVRSGVISGALNAADFRGTDFPAQREAGYTKAGFAPELAASFHPFWFDLFDATGMSTTTSDGTVLVDGSASPITQEVVAVSSTGAEGHRVFVVDVEVSVRMEWGENPTGRAYEHQLRPSVDVPYTVTFDEESGLVTDVVQPSRDDLPETARPSVK